jgi:Domain of unknown function DUF29
MSQKEKKGLGNYLANLMMHIIKWKSQPEKRSKSWIDSIKEARDQIAEAKKKKPSLTDSYILTLWEKAFKKAIKDAEEEMEKKTHLQNLSWKEVFVDQYVLAEGKWKMWLLLMSILWALYWVF